MNRTKEIELKEEIENFFIVLNFKTVDFAILFLHMGKAIKNENENFGTFL